VSDSRVVTFEALDANSIYFASSLSLFGDYAQFPFWLENGLRVSRSFYLLDAAYSAASLFSLYLIMAVFRGMRIDC
jgi:hypothetical protein